MRDAVRVQTVVSVPPAEAFTAFTAHIDRWWRTGSRFRWLTGGGVMAFVDDQLVEYTEDERFVVGDVTAWEPGTRLAFTWRARTFEPGESTTVDVTFEVCESGTRVVLVHAGWDAIATNHPARRGTGRTSSFTGWLGLYWADLLGALRAGARP